MKRFFSVLLAVLLIVFVPVAGASAAVVTEAPQNDRVFDDFSRSTVEGIKTDGTVLWVAPRFPDGYGANINDGVLELSYQGNGDYFGEGTDIALENYVYLVMRVRGAAGGEGSDFSMTTEYNETSAKRKIFSTYVGPDNQPIPAITTDWQYIVIDMTKSGMGVDSDPDFLDLTFKFESGKSGKIFIDEIYMTNQDFDFAVDIPADQISTVPNPEQSATQPSGSDPILVDKDKNPVQTVEIQDAGGNTVVVGLVTDAEGNQVPVRIVRDENGNLKTVESVTNESGVEVETKDTTLPDGYSILESTTTAADATAAGETNGKSWFATYWWILLVAAFLLIVCGAVYLSRKAQRKDAGDDKPQAPDQTKNSSGK